MRYEMASKTARTPGCGVFHNRGFLLKGGEGGFTQLLMTQ